MRETSLALFAFAVYVQLGPRRSLGRLRGELKRRQRELALDRVPGERTLARWSSEFHWQERLGELEHEAAQQLNQALAAEQAEALERRRKLGLSLQQQGLQVLRARSEEDWSVRDALRAVEKGSAMETESLGANVGNPDSDDLLRRVTQRLDVLTDEQLERLAGTGPDGGEDRSGAARPRRPRKVD